MKNELKEREGELTFQCGFRTMPLQLLLKHIYAWTYILREHKCKKDEDKESDFYFYFLFFYFE